MQAKVLTLAERGEFDKLYKEVIGSKAPSITCSKILVVEEAGETIAFAAMVLVPQLEPVWVREDYRGTSALLRLVRLAQAELAPIADRGLTHISDSKLGEVLSHLGWEHLKDIQTYSWHREKK